MKNSAETVSLITNQRFVAHLTISMKLFLFVVFSLSLLKAYAWDSAAVQASCGDEDIPSGSSYFNNLQYVFADIEKNTCLTKGYTYKTQHSGGGNTAYALGSCTSSLRAGVCSDCLKFLADNIWQYCGSAIVAILDMPNNCNLRFQDTSF
ncbi:hypothetical protein O6H91_07G126200 [Diphasiastrum complanatum]|uniref:Uncharacterized protein n=1 Tax=Diphasiastrum complanatum TaxID=34168 RepID=A0ACC2D9I8_DIPCM|nr:hypothetical protein O6H91_07G126200 [Diphasiastrum complanatum]